MGEAMRLVGLYYNMQNQLKALDKELQNNGLYRIPDCTQRPQNSLLRALSMSIFYSHSYTQEVLREVRLTLASNLGDKRSNCYPAINETNILKKYQSSPDLLLEFWEFPDLVCFHNDILVIASAAFCRTVILLALDKDDYLTETYICACKNPGRERLLVGRAGRKYFAVLENGMRERIGQVREVVGQLLDDMLEQDTHHRVHYPNYDQMIMPVMPAPRHRAHKKSLSDCGELPLQTAFDPALGDYQDGSERGYQPNYDRNYKERMQEEFFQPKYVKPVYFHEPPKAFELTDTPAYPDPMEHLDNAYTNYYSYPYAPYVMPTEPAYAYVDHPAPINNERYTGRLKFFDQAGNYGFIVIDNLNIDLFVHFDDLSRAGLSKEKLVSLKNNYELRFEFTYYEYEGKQHKKSKKAIDLVMIPAEPAL